MPASSAACANFSRSSNRVASGRSASSTWSKSPNFMDPRLGRLGRCQGGRSLVSRFRSSHHSAAHSFANFGIKGTLGIYDSSAGFGFEVPTQTRGYNDRNFKSTALVELDISAISQDLGPAFRLAADERCELGRRAAADREDARLFQSGDHGGVAIHARDLAMDVV